ncbi:MAG TPA: 3-hydroxyacyl-CoA dehydrogenase NAD-binding domain-containing protein [Ktedonobacteraceae bacterium]|nr:3-hydroxyacyl-CoA dehydrogenase NAD-binding domain-containing protein [Ktedonobacteraceae bacterium]
MNIRTVGVIGAGVMGVGVAQNLAQTGYNVVLIDISEAILNQAREEISKNIRLQRMWNKKPGQESLEEINKRITFTQDYRLFMDVDFVIENATEKWEIKKKIYEQIDQLCRENIIFAVNTSAISITRVGSITKRPENVIGTHFMNPVPMKKTVEVIRGYHTSEETIAETKALLAGMGKESIVVNDMPGFVSNRVLMLTVNEAIYLVQDQVASAEDVDHVFKSCFGHPMGPLETADLIGLDTILYSVEVLYESYNDSKYRPCPLLKKMVDAGLYGRKNGQGFYTYR